MKLNFFYLVKYIFLTIYLILLLFSVSLFLLDINKIVVIFLIFLFATLIYKIYVEKLWIFEITSGLIVIFTIMYSILLVFVFKDSKIQERFNISLVEGFITECILLFIIFCYYFSYKELKKRNNKNQLE